MNSIHGTSMFTSTMTVVNSELRDSGFDTKSSQTVAIQNSADKIHHYYGLPVINSCSASELDFSQPAIRCAYLYLFFTSHVRFIENLWKDFLTNATVQKWFSQHQISQSVRVCSVGGGPGSDIFGFALFLNSIRSKLRVNSDVLDYWKQWEVTYRHLVRVTSMEDRPLKNTTYHQFNFLDTNDTNDMASKIASADLVTLIKFVSAVGYDRTFCEEKLENLLRNVKRGALVLFVDNSGGGYFELMNRVSDAIGLECVVQFQKKASCVTAYDLLIMNSWASHINKQPQKKTEVCASLWYQRYQTPVPRMTSPPTQLQVHNFRPTNIYSSPVINNPQPNFNSANISQNFTTTNSWTSWVSSLGYRAVAYLGAAHHFGSFLVNFWSIFGHIGTFLRHFWHFGAT